MKILYITIPKPDYQQDIVYTGLVKTVGINNVIEYPWNIRYHINFRDYPKNMGRMDGTFFSSIVNQFKLKDVDVVIVASCRFDTLKYYNKIVKDLPKKVKTIFLDGGDMPEVSGDLDLADNDGRKLYGEITSFREFDFIFKREYLLDKKYDDNVYSLPFGFNLDHLPKKLPKFFKYDVAFWAVESDPIRTKALELLENKYDCNENGTMRNQIMKKYKRKGQFYLEELSACKVGLNFRGGGWDTLRFWEIPALGGFMISQKLDIKIDNNFINGENIVYCENDLSDLTELCDYYLKHEDKRIKIGQNAREHLEQYHTDVCRAEKILSIIKF